MVVKDPDCRETSSRSVRKNCASCASDVIDRDDETAVPVGQGADQAAGGRSTGVSAVASDDGECSRGGVAGSRTRAG